LCLLCIGRTRDSEDLTNRTFQPLLRHSDSRSRRVGNPPDVERIHRLLVCSRSIFRRASGIGALCSKRIGFAFPEGFLLGGDDLGAGSSFGGRFGEELVDRIQL
jgi:hypothetical protein